jgi:hypothetical protein
MAHGKQANILTVKHEAFILGLFAKFEASV